MFLVFVLATSFEQGGLISGLIFNAFGGFGAREKQFVRCCLECLFGVKLRPRLMLLSNISLFCFVQRKAVRP